MGVFTSHQVEENQAMVNLIMDAHHSLQQQVESFWKTESFGCAYKKNSVTSTEDRRALNMLDVSTRLVEGHYEVGMLWRESDVKGE